MADIQFNFQSEDLDKIKKLLDDMVKAADAIGKNLNKSGEDSLKSAKQLAAEAKKAENELKKQLLIEQKLIDAENKRAAAAELAGKKIEIANKKAEITQDNLNKKIAKGNENTNTWSKALNSFQFKFNALGNIADTVLTSLISNTKRAIIESVKMAAVTEGVANAYRKLNQSPAYLDELRKATRGAVNDLDLMKAAVQARNFKIPLDKLATLLKFAGDRAMATGQSFDYMVESLVLGLGRQSVLRLDNVGLSVKELNDEVEKTGNFFEGTTNVIEREMAKAGRVIDTTGTQMAQLRADSQNMMVDFGNAIIRGSGLVSGYSKYQKIATADASEFQKIWQSFDREDTEGYQDLLDQVKSNSKEFSELVEQIREWKKLNGFVEPEQKEITTITTLGERLAGYKKELEDTDITDKESLKTINKKIEETEFLINAYSNLGKEVKNLPILKSLDPKDVIGDLTNSTKEFLSLFKGGNDLFGNIEDTSDELEKADQEAIAKREANIDAHNEYVKKKKQEDLDAEEDARKEKIAKAQSVLTAIGTTYNALSDIFEANKQKELSAAGDNAAKREEIERKYAKKQQNIAIGQALIDTSSGILKTYADYGYSPLGIALMAAGAVAAGIQVTAIKAQKFAKGGEVDGRLHSQGGTMIEAERGEYVINRKSTGKYRGLIEGINEDNQARIMSALSQDKRVNVVNRQDMYTKKIYERLMEQEVYGETPGFYVVHKGTKKTLIKK